MSSRGQHRLIALLVALALLAAAPAVARGAELVIMATTDIHANIYPWDYYANVPSDNVGLAKIYTLVKEIRADYPNTLLLDNGDLIQGTPLASYLVNMGLPRPGELHPIIDVLNRMGYDAATLGNHEFNFGLDYADNTYAGAQFPFVLANVYYPGTQDPYYEPYVILERTIDGHPIRIGVIGFVPPQIMTWDRTHLTGKVEAGSILDAAARFVPEMLAQGVDVLIALSHSGAYPGNRAENASYELAMEFPEFDVIIAGHSHLEIPGPGLPEHPDAKVNGVQLVQPGFWGQYLGVVFVDLERDGEGWKVTGTRAELRPTAPVEPAPEVLAWARDVHEATVAYVNEPIGETLIPISSRANLLADNAVTQLINEVQMAYVEELLKGTEYEGLPVLSAAAPYKSGRGGELDWTEIPAGGITVGDVASIYIYDNTLKALLVNGEELKAWLEHAAQKFHTMTPGRGEEPLYTDFRGYNFDQIDGIEYKIDVTRPLGQRIVDLTFQGEPVQPDQWFILATNNYRADGGGGFPATGAAGRLVLDPGIASRELIVQYIADRGVINPVPDHNWQLVPNYLDHPQAHFVYELIKRNAYVGDLEGRLLLDAPLTRKVWADMVYRALQLRLDVANPDAVVTAAEAARDLAAYLPGTAVAGAADEPLTNADGAQLLVGVLAVADVVSGR